MGHGWAPAVTALDYGMPIGLSSDVATTAPSDQFTQMRSIFGSERGRKHQESWDADLDGLEAVARPHHVAPGAVVGDHRRGRGRRDRRPDRFADPGQEGRHRHHRRLGGERGADHRPGRGGRLRRRRLERQDGLRRRRERSRRTSGSRPRSTARARRSRRRATICSRSSATRSRAGSPRQRPSFPNRRSRASPGRSRPPIKRCRGSVPRRRRRCGTGRRCGGLRGLAACAGAGGVSSFADGVGAPFAGDADAAGVAAAVVPGATGSRSMVRTWRVLPLSVLTCADGMTPVAKRSMTAMSPLYNPFPVDPGHGSR